MKQHPWILPTSQRIFTSLNSFIGVRSIWMPLELCSLFTLGARALSFVRRVPTPLGSPLSCSIPWGGQPPSRCHCCPPATQRVLVLSLTCVAKLCTTRNAETVWTRYLCRSWEEACAFSTIKVHLGVQEEPYLGSGWISPLLLSISTSPSFPHLVSGLIRIRVFGPKGTLWIDSWGFTLWSFWNYMPASVNVSQMLKMFPTWLGIFWHVDTCSLFHWDEEVLTVVTSI